jgi:hypothetical protein
LGELLPRLNIVQPEAGEEPAYGPLQCIKKDDRSAQRNATKNFAPQHRQLKFDLISYKIEAIA